MVDTSIFLIITSAHFQNFALSYVSCLALLWFGTDQFYLKSIGLLHWCCGDLCVVSLETVPGTLKNMGTNHLSSLPFLHITKSIKLDDVIKWKHFPRYWPFVRGIHWSPANSPHKGQLRGALMFSLICAWINAWVNNREADDLRPHRAYYDLIAMRATSRWHRNMETLSTILAVCEGSPPVKGQL